MFHHKQIYIEVLEFLHGMVELFPLTDVKKKTSQFVNQFILVLYQYDIKLEKV